MATLQKITPCLWFDDKAELAAEFYVSIFENSSIKKVSRYTQDTYGKPEGSVLTVEFELQSQRFTALNGGPMFKFTEAVSFQISCQTQDEVDHYWNKLGEGGDPKSQQCGWLKDKFGLSWQVVPDVLIKLLTGPDRARAKRVMAVMMKMKKLDIAGLEAA